MKKNPLYIFAVLAVLYMFISLLLFFYQEKLIFFPQKLDKTYTFNFDQKFEELNIKAKDGKLLNGLLFKSAHSKGLIFYLHGNAGSLATWGEVAKTYTDLHYDVFILDYRGYGKSEGTIKGQTQFFDDVQAAYDEMKTRYAEEKIVVLGYSIGTGAAAKTASVNHPGLLVLQAPYYNLTDMMKHLFPVIPTFILKYKFETNKYIQECKMPVVIFHGTQDEVIYYGSSEKLAKHFKQTDRLIPLHGQSHNGMTTNPQYQMELNRILNP